jgi:hypothetical protein
LMTVTGSPMLLPPSLNWTVPAASRGFTIAMRVTGRSAGKEPLGSAMSVVVVA